MDLDQDETSRFRSPINQYTPTGSTFLDYTISTRLVDGQSSMANIFRTIPSLTDTLFEQLSNHVGERPNIKAAILSQSLPALVVGLSIDSLTSILDDHMVHSEGTTKTILHRTFRHKESADIFTAYAYLYFDQRNEQKSAIALYVCDYDLTIHTRLVQLDLRYELDKVADDAGATKVNDIYIELAIKRNSVPSNHLSTYKLPCMHFLSNRQNDVEQMPLCYDQIRILKNRKTLGRQKNYIPIQTLWIDLSSSDGVINSEYDIGNGVTTLNELKTENPTFINKVASLQGTRKCFHDKEYPGRQGTKRKTDNDNTGDSSNFQKLSDDSVISAGQPNNEYSSEMELQLREINHMDDYDDRIFICRDDNHVKS